MLSCFMKTMGMHTPTYKRQKWKTTERFSQSVNSTKSVNIWTLMLRVDPCSIYRNVYHLSTLAILLPAVSTSCIAISISSLAWSTLARFLTILLAISVASNSASSDTLPFWLAVSCLWVWSVYMFSKPVSCFSNALHTVGPSLRMAFATGTY